MAHKLSLAFLTLAPASPVEAIDIAEQCGFDHVGLRLLPAAAGEPDYPLLHDRQCLSDVLARLADSPVTIADVEIARLGAEGDVERLLPLLDRAAALGARHVLTAGDDPDPSRLTDTFARFCALAQERALTVDLEFMPWTAVKCARSAQAIVAAAGAANGGILVDALHFDRSATTLEDVRQLPPSRLHYAQLCDAPADFDPTDEGLIAVARGGRLFPGEGGIDLTGLVRALPGDIPLSVEVINTGLFQGMSLLERGRRAMASARRVLMHAESAPA
ncbi:MAG TPA: TIM barrel protein [Novosphingobium sp.]|nr:TIM barrel protein [Novosphingobium sp.]HZV09180.1 TIM barrel protein [Novosphingobium sp.]